MGSPIIVVVDDNPVMLQVAISSLRRFNLDVHTAASGKKALDAVASCLYDLIFMDVIMPEMDGLEATRKLRESGCSVPIIGVTSVAERQHCFAAGINDCSPKPADYKAIIERWLPQWQQLTPTVSEELPTSSLAAIQLPNGTTITAHSPTQVLLDVARDFDEEKIEMTVEQVQALCHWLLTRRLDEDKLVHQWLEGEQ